MLTASRVMVPGYSRHQLGVPMLLAWPGIGPRPIYPPDITLRCRTDPDAAIVGLQQCLFRLFQWAGSIMTDRNGIG